MFKRTSLYDISTKRKQVNIVRHASNWGRRSACHPGTLLCWLAFFLLSPLATHAYGDEPTPPHKEKPLREIFIPFEDLESVLSGTVRRVFLERDQYEDLLAKVKTSPEVNAPRPFVLLSTKYQGEIDGNHARLTGTFEIEVLQDGVQAIGLSIGTLRMSRASLDDQPASLGDRGDGNLQLFVEGKGSHKLVVELLAPVATGVADQTLNLNLPQGAASTFALQVPGDVELKSGGTVIRREVDAGANTTRFDLLLPKQATTLLLTLNNRRQAEDRAVLARSVLVDELTEVYERLHATVSLEVVHGAAEQFRFALPADLEITSVTSPLVARWEVKPGDTPTLEVLLREPLTTSAVLAITAARKPGKPDAWEFPRLVPLDVAGQVAVLGLLLESRLKPVRLDAESLIAISASALGETLAATSFDVEPGAPPLRAVAAYYAPQGDYKLSAALEKPPARLWATTNVLLLLGSTQLEVQGGFALLPLAERIFQCDIEVPAGWYLDRLTYGTDTPLAIQQYPQADGTTRVHVRLPQAVEPGVTYNLVFHATSTPEGWLGQWKDSKKSLTYPVFRVLDAARDVGAIAVQARDDLAVQPGEIEGLLPLDEARKGEFGMAGIPTSLAYYYEKHPYRAELIAERLTSRQTARVFSFFQVSADQVTAHYELLYEISDAQASTLKLLLPAWTPKDIAIRALDGVKIKSYEATGTKPMPVKGYIVSGANEHRQWTVHLAERRSGVVRLAVDFEVPFDAEKQKQFALPLAAAGDVAYQTGIVAIEGDAELELKVDAGEARPVDVGELVDAEYQPGKRLLGVFGYVGQPQRVSIEAARHDPHGLPIAIVQRSELVTVVSASGESQTAARFQLRTKAPFLEIKLPPDAKLWSAVVDGTPAKPQTQEDPNTKEKRLLLSLPTRPASMLRNLQIVYELPVRSLKMWAKLAVPAPELTLRSAGGSVPLPTADLVWHLYLPTGYELVKSDGTVFTTELDRRRRSWLMDLAQRTSPDLKVDLFDVSSSMLAAKTEVSAAAESADESFDGTADVDFDDARVQSGSGRFMVGVGVNSDAGVVGSVTEDADHRHIEAPKSATEMPSEELAAAPADEPALDLPREALKRDLEKEKYFAQRSEMDRLPNPESAPAPTAAPSDPQDVTRATNAPRTTGEFRRAQVPESNPLGLSGQLAGNDGSGPWDTDNDGDGSGGPWQSYGLNNRARAAQAGWALEGLRSLKIDLQPTGEAVRFESLGDAPELSVTLIDRRKTDLLSMGVGLAVLLIGFCLTRKSTGTKLRYIIGILLVTTLLPLITGWGAELGYALDAAFYAALLLVPYYVAVAIGRRLWQAAAHTAALQRMTPVATLLLVSTTLWLVQSSNTAHGQQPPAPTGAANSGAASEPTTAALEAIDPDEVLIPVKVPAEAILIPYDADDEQGVSKATRLMIPYDKYVSLWNRAYPHKRLDTHPLPAQFGLAGAKLSATLGDGETLEVAATIELDILADDTVAIPLPLEGGVIVRATLDGKPARLKIVEALPRANNAPNAPQSEQAVTQQQLAVAGAPNAMVMVYANGKGRQTLELTIRYPLTRQGGWRIAAGHIPAASATALVLTVPRTATEVRLTSCNLTANYETKADNETIGTALDASGNFRLEWRPRVGEAMIDRGLTVDSQAVLDVQEDGLRLLWQLGLSFRNSQREQFPIDLPSGWLVEKVGGGNVRGWTVEETEKGQRLSVTLLKAAQGGETLSLQLSRRKAIGIDAADEFSVPAIRVEDAALETGKLLIRRSPLLEVRTLESTGVSRLNLEEVSALGQLVTSAESPLGIRAFQAYRFIALPFSLKLSAQSLAVPVTARVQTLLKIAEQDRRVETRIGYHAAERSIYRLRVAVSTGLELDEPIVPGAFEWVSREEENRQVIEIMLADGQQGDFAIVLRGVLETGDMTGALTLPEVEVLDVVSQTGEIAVQADPALDVQTRELTKCERVSVRQADGWLQAEQRATVQLVLAYRAAGYSGTLSVTPRQAQVVASTVTNMRVTERTLEETMLLEFNITGAGIRQIVFRMPEWMRNARIRVPMLREKKIEEVSKDEIRVRLTLQDAIMGQVRVLVENDRLPNGDEYKVPLPTIEGAQTAHRFASLESSGRDEILVDRHQGLEPLDREQALWRSLTALLPGGNITQAFVVAPGAKSPELVLKPQRRDVVKTTQARIGLAQTLLVVDAAGAYRATQTYRVDNATEQHLDIRLPAGAELWTARVAGEPVKPAQVPGQAEQVRIPLVKTAAGDQDFEVSLKYGGKILGWGGVSTVSFPLLHTVNIQVDQSQVRLWLPEQYRWFDFGGSMGMVTDEGDLLAGFLAYKNRQIQKLMETLSETGSYSSVRAKSNLKQVEEELSEVTSRSGEYLDNAGYAKQLDSNKRFLDEAKNQIRAEESKVKASDENFNRSQLNSNYFQQHAQRSSNVVNSQSSNFDFKGIEGKKAQPEFKTEWFEGQQPKPSGEAMPADKPQSGEGSGQGEGEKQGGGKAGRGQKGPLPKRGQYGGYAPQYATAQPKAAEAFNRQRLQTGDVVSVEDLKNGERRLKGSSIFNADPSSNQPTKMLTKQSKDDDLRRYEQKLNEQQKEGELQQQAVERLQKQVQELDQTETEIGEQLEVRASTQFNGVEATQDAKPGYWRGRQPGQEFVGANLADEQPGVYVTAEQARAEAQAARELASLDVAIPERGVEYMFTTPRGEVEITARAISKPVSHRLLRLVLVGLFIVASTLVYRRFARRGE